MMTASNDTAEGSKVVKGAKAATPGAESDSAVELDAPQAPEPEDLLGQLSRAMHSAAASQHRRMIEDLAQERVAQVGAIEKRAGIESETLKRTSEHDVDQIDAWATEATEMIATERTRRIEARRERLEAELRRHELIVEREVMAVEVTLEEHQARLEAFYKGLGDESDPAAIAQIAATLPALPSLAEAAEAARRHAAAEFAPIDEPGITPAPDGGSESVPIEVSPSRLLAVMDPDSAKATQGEGINTWREPHAIAVAAGEVANEPIEGEARRDDAPARSEGRPLLRAVPSIRPVDYLRGGTPALRDDPDRET
jgi:hypothetical protein